MIKVYFSDPGCGDLDVEKELGITEDADVFFTKNIPGLEFEGMDSVADLDDNLILWFSAKDEETCMQKISEMIKSCILPQSQMQYQVTMTSEYSWYD